MAVYQISKIQVRRGVLSDLPQLASGELGWSIDTQQLFIGNGSVSEGAAQVGNTKILTEKDISSSLTQSIEHIYKFSSAGSIIQTGNSLSSPISKPLQTKLDDTVYTSDFGTVGNGLVNDTNSLRRAVTQLFDNSISLAASEAGASMRVILSIPAGIYLIDDSIPIPSYATIIGAGVNKTIIRHSGSNPVFVFNNGSNIILRDLTIESTATSGTVIGLNLNSTTNSEFSNIRLKGTWVISQLSTFTSKAIVISAASNNNTFKNIQIDQFCYGVYIPQTVSNTLIDTGTISNSGYGIQIGGFGTPTDTSILNFKFSNVVANAINITNGTYTHIDNCSMATVANLTNATGTYPQIYVGQHTNTCINIRSDRHTTATETNYRPVVAGSCEYTSQTFKVSLPTVDSVAVAFRLPLNCTATGGVETSPVVYNIPYSYRADTYTKVGTLSVTYSGATAELSDEYTCVGTTANATALTFSVTINQTNKVLTVNYFNTVTSSYRDLVYHYTAIF